MEKVEVAIIGAGVVGLSIAARISGFKNSVCVMERHDSFGRETSSRNSEVIHAGIYYPAEALKTKMCLEGNNLIYETCAKNNIP
ncbi:MAG: FAD-dependent oxidoreductase, partial [Candidatus Omnitrophota bacterium]|nr:FAD-dependent oxidoreductase [Candidatus Omnitrophota bacterium]